VLDNATATSPPTDSVYIMRDTFHDGRNAFLSPPTSGASVDGIVRNEGRKEGSEHGSGTALGRWATCARGPGLDGRDRQPP